MAKTLYQLGETVTLGGGVTLSRDTTNATVTGQLQQMIGAAWTDVSISGSSFNATSNFTTDVEVTYTTLNGSLVTVTPTSAGSYRWKITVSGGTPDCGTSTFYVEFGVYTYAEAPSTPAITSIENKVSHVDVTVNGDSGVVNYVTLYNTNGTSIGNGSRSGNGIITISPESTGLYITAIAYSYNNGVYSLPSAPVTMFLVYS